MSKPTQKNNIRPAQDFQRRSFPAKTYITRLAERLIWDFSEVGDNTIAGRYYGRTLNSVKAQGRAIVAHYFERSKSGQALTLEAVTFAANTRLKILQLAEVIKPSDLGEPAIHIPRPYSPSRVNTTPLYLQSPKTISPPMRYIDNNLEISYQAIDSFLFEQPDRSSLLHAASTVDYLVQHPGLDPERRLILAGTYEAMTIREGLRVPPVSAPDYSRLTRGRA